MLGMRHTGWSCLSIHRFSGKLPLVKRNAVCFERDAFIMIEIGERVDSIAIVMKMLGRSPYEPF